MNISIFGLGHVGTVCAACLAERGHRIIGIDKSETKVRLVRSGRSPIVERDIDQLINKSVQSGRLMATIDAVDAIARSDISLVCVGTPGRPNGSLNLDAIEEVANEIGCAVRVKSSSHTVVVRSTVLPGTTRNVILPRLAESSANAPIRIAVNPEFLREGSSIGDFNSPAKTIVGGLDDDAISTAMTLYEDLPGPKIATDLETAELIKYVDNAWHALKVAFGNEIGAIAKPFGIDSRRLMDIFVQDTQLNLSPAYLRPGFAFGGSCLPKDLRALTYLARSIDLSLPVLGHILDSNRLLIERGVEWIHNKGRKRIGFLGISFKSSTDDVRESPFVEVIERLNDKGCEVKIFDPSVHLSDMIGANREYFMRIIPHVMNSIVTDASDLLEWAEVIVITTADPRYDKVAARSRPNQIVLDLSYGAHRPSGSVKAEGLLW